MTLVEVLIATAILAISLAALGRRGFVAIQAAQKAERESAAAQIAREGLDGLLAGTLAAPAQELPWSAAPEWNWWVETGPSEEPQLLTLSVHVRHQTDRPGISRLTLSQLVRRSALPHLAHPSITASR